MATILLIEDDTQLRILIQHMLVTDGHTVIAVADGRSGLQHARASAPDLVLTDVNMPEKDGFEVIMELHHLDPRHRVIAMSGGCGDCADRDNLLKMAHRLGAWDTLPKPFSPDELKARVARALKGRTVADLIQS